MATAREILFQTWLINIGTQGSPTSPDQKIANGDWIEFQNNANFSVSITFTTTGGTVFNNIPNIPAGGRSQPQQAQKSNITVDYFITNLNNNQVQGPYGIEVGSGPIEIDIQGGQTDPPIVSIPQGGKIQFDNEDSVPYNIVWNPAGVFSPNVNPIQPGTNAVQTAQIGNQIQTVTYTFASDDGTSGGGTVHINS